MSLLGYAKDKYSSSGNDGIIEKIFKRLDIKNGFFVEFGGWDGVYLSNCRKLFEEGWSGIFIEGDKARHEECKKNYKGEDRIKSINAFVEEEGNTFDNLVQDFVPNTGIDFCSIDIDGLDLEIFETFKKFMPKVVCIEGGQMLPPRRNKVKREQAKNNIQQSLSVMCGEFWEKGYEMICTHQDTFFVEEKYMRLFSDTRARQSYSYNLGMMYLRGLEHLPRRLPYIQKTLAEVGLKNEVVDEIVEKANVSKVNSGKQWSEEEVERVKEQIRKYPIATV